MSKYVSDLRVEGSRGTTGAPHPYQGQAIATAPALSVARAATTIFTVKFGGGIWNATLA